MLHPHKIKRLAWQNFLNLKITSRLLYLYLKKETHNRAINLTSLLSYFKYNFIEY